MDQPIEEGKELTLCQALQRIAELEGYLAQADVVIREADERIRQLERESD